MNDRSGVNQNNLNEDSTPNLVNANNDATRSSFPPASKQHLRLTKQESDSSLIQAGIVTTSNKWIAMQDRSAPTGKVNHHLNDQQ